MDHGAAERPDTGASPSSADLRMLSGDVMLGSAVDQILPHPGDPTLRERAVGDARTYVALLLRPIRTRRDRLDRAKRGNKAPGGPRLCRPSFGSVLVPLTAGTA